MRSSPLGADANYRQRGTAQLQEEHCKEMAVPLNRQASIAEAENGVSHNGHPIHRGWGGAVRVAD